MPEKFLEKTRLAAEIPEEEKKMTDAEIESFFDKEAEILGVYGMKGEIALEWGGAWAFDFKNKKLIYDPGFFAERGYNLKETLFATTHELLAHYTELLRDPKLVLKEINRYCQKEHLHLLYNIFEDVLGNRRIVAELPFLEETKKTLYKEKCFPKTDYQEYAHHIQFAYGFIREAMVPDEPIKISAEAREALEKLRKFGKGKTDILELVTTPAINPEERFKIMRRIVEPIYLELYRKDLEREIEKEKNGEKTEEAEEGEGGEKKKDEERKGDDGKSQKQKDKTRGKKGKEMKGRPGTEKEKIGKDSKERPEQESKKQAEEKFKKQYKDYENSHPKPLSKKDEEKLKETLKEIAGGKKGGEPSFEKAILEQWAREHGLKPEDIINYRCEYQEVAPLVAELREVFRKIISRRLKERWKISPQLKKEGEELEETVLTEAYVESLSGGEPRAFREIEHKKREEKGYGVLDMTLVCDLSESMNKENGEKLVLERKSAVLFLESLADFQREIEEAEYESGISLGMEVRTEVRAFGDFGDVPLKPLSSKLPEKERINIWKKLHQAEGGTPDYLSLEETLKSITPEYEKELKEKTRRKVIVVLSDGESNDAVRVQRVLKELRGKGTIVLGLGMTESGAEIKQTYQPDGELVEEIKDLPKTLKKIIIKYTQDL